LAARYAGYNPNIIPTPALIPKAKINEPVVITVRICPKWVTKKGIKEPKNIPKIPPDSVKINVSERN
jgi:hypothetical protein